MLKDNYPWREMLKPNAGVVLVRGQHCDPNFDIDAALEQATKDKLSSKLIEEITQDILGSIGCSHCGEKFDKKSLIRAQARLLTYLNKVQDTRKHGKI